MGVSFMSLFQLTDTNMHLAHLAHLAKIRHRIKFAMCPHSHMVCSTSSIEMVGMTAYCAYPSFISSSGLFLPPHPFVSSLAISAY